MSESKWTIELRCNGEKVLVGDIEQLHELGDGMVRNWQFDLVGCVELRITREKAEEVRPV